MIFLNLIDCFNSIFSFGSILQQGVIDAEIALKTVQFSLVVPKLPRTHQIAVKFIDFKVKYSAHYLRNIKHFVNVDITQV